MENTADKRVRQPIKIVAIKTSIISLRGSFRAQEASLPKADSQKTGRGWKFGHQRVAGIR